MYRITLFVFITCSLIPVHGQVIHDPNIGAKSHPTLSIIRIEKTENYISIDFMLENQSKVEDNFCVDKGTYLECKEEKFILEGTTGITICPTKIYFKTLEKKIFTLQFPPINEQVYYFDIIEPCTKFCFFFKGVIVDRHLNDKIDEAYRNYREGYPEKAGTIFKQLIEKYVDYPYGIWYFSLLNILEEQGKTKEYNAWVEKLARSTIKDKLYYLELIEK